MFKLRKYFTVDILVMGMVNLDNSDYDQLKIFKKDVMEDYKNIGMMYDKKHFLSVRNDREGGSDNKIGF